MKYINCPICGKHQPEVNYACVQCKTLFGLLLILFFIMPSAYADTPQYGITVSNTCLVMLKNNIPTDCPTYEQIMILFPDTTLPDVSGKFVEKDGMLQRDVPPMVNSWRYYGQFTNESVLWIDPPGDVRKKIKMIVIEPSLPEYKIQGESTKLDDYTLTFGKDRSQNINCSEIKITAENWVFLLGDSINYIKHNCDKLYTSFDHTINLKLAKSYQDISTSYKWFYDNWVKTNMEDCKKKGCK